MEYRHGSCLIVSDITNEDGCAAEDVIKAFIVMQGKDRNIRKQQRRHKRGSRIFDFDTIGHFK